MTAEYRIELPSPTPETAEPRARTVLETAQSTLGFIPNMYAQMAKAPALLDTYAHGYALFRSESGFTPVEQEVILLTISRFNGCEYCVGAHSAIAAGVSKVPSDVLSAIREGNPIPDPRLNALSMFTDLMVESRGKPTRRDVEAFLNAGYQEQHILQIVLAIAVKTLSNYSNHLNHSELDTQFADFAWRES